VTADEWVESTLRSLTLREKVGQMTVPWLDGSYMAVGNEEYEKLRNWVVNEGVGGIIISIGPPLEVAAKLNEAQKLAKVPLLVAADLEHGPGQRLDGGVVMPYGIVVGGGVKFPPMMGLGATGDPQLAYELGRITALEGRAVGIHMNYAPVADVNNNPANPIINTRSFGEDPAAVGRMVQAAVRGMQENGMISTVKHFPGHGDTGTDSHMALPILTIDRARFDEIELVPFRAAIEAGVEAVMSAHIAFPALTGDSVPATLNPKLLTGLLQEELGFDGLVVTDALDMAGVAAQYSQAEMGVLAVKAGADVLLMSPQNQVLIDGVVAAVRRGEIPESRIDHSVRKILRAKAKMGLHRQRTVDLESVTRQVGTPQNWAVALEAAQRSITVARDRDGLLPLSPAKVKRVLNIAYADDIDPLTGRVFDRELRKALPGVEVTSVVLDARSPATQLEETAAAAQRADVVLFSPYVRVRDRKGDVSVAENIGDWVKELTKTRPVIVTAFGSPYVIGQFPDISTYVLAWGQVDVLQRAAARALTGQAPVTGRLPISYLPHFRMGDGLQLEPLASAEAAR